MKGWIKVHTTEGVEIYMRASMIEYVYKREGWTVISLTKEDGHARVTETVEEVLALIEEAEGLKEEKEDWEQDKGDRQSKGC